MIPTKAMNIGIQGIKWTWQQN